jgi:signal transduction histidine kinase
MTPLAKALWSFSAESGFEPADLEADDQGRKVFRRFGEKLLEMIATHHKAMQRGYLAVAGLSRSALQVAAARPPDSPEVGRDIPRSLSDALFSGDTKFRALTLGEASRLPGSLRPGEIRFAIKLVGNGEFFGLLCLDAVAPSPLILERMDEFEAEWRAICRCVSEAVFSMRLEALAAPFDFAGFTGEANGMEAKLLEQICQQATLGFAADGAVLRIFDERTGQLAVRSKWGDIRHHPEESRGPGERICECVFEGSLYGTARTISTGRGFGTEITQDDEDLLRAAGIGSYMVMRLQSDIAAASHDARIGTLSLFHYREHEFSLRDIRLFRAYTERVADDLALVSNIRELEVQEKLMRTQFSVLTRAELISLLAHDVGHKAIRATEQVVDFTDAVKKAIKEKQSFNSIASAATDAREACLRVESELAQIKQITKHVDEAPVPFSVKDVFEDIRRDFGAVLDRNNMDMEIVTQGSTTCFGPRKVFEQVIFNLVINSIDAQKSRRHRNKNVIHVHCREETAGSRRKLTIQFWDDGPGISFPHFPDPNDVFVLGRSSKPEGEGTGTGLPMSRSLLDRYFRGELQLKDRQKARFEIRFEPQDPPNP